MLKLTFLLLITILSINLSHADRHVGKDKKACYFYDQIGESIMIAIGYFTENNSTCEDTPPPTDVDCREQRPLNQSIYGSAQCLDLTNTNYNRANAPVTENGIYIRQIVSYKNNGDPMCAHIRGSNPTKLTCSAL